MKKAIYNSLLGIVVVVAVFLVLTFVLASNQELLQFLMRMLMKIPKNEFSGTQTSLTWSYGVSIPGITPESQIRLNGLTWLNKHLRSVPFGIISLLSFSTMIGCVVNILLFHLLMGRVNSLKLWWSVYLFSFIGSTILIHLLHPLGNRFYILFVFLFAFFSVLYWFLTFFFCGSSSPLSFTLKRLLKPLRI